MRPPPPTEATAAALALAEQQRRVRDLEEQVVGLEQQVVTLRATLAQRDATLALRDAQVSDLGVQLGAAQQQLQELRHAAAERHAFGSSLPGTSLSNAAAAEATVGGSCTEYDQTHVAPPPWVAAIAAATATREHSDPVAAPPSRTGSTEQSASSHAGDVAGSRLHSGPGLPGGASSAAAVRDGGDRRPQAAHCTATAPPGARVAAAGVADALPPQQAVPSADAAVSPSSLVRESHVAAAHSSEAAECDAPGGSGRGTLAGAAAAQNRLTGREGRTARGGGGVGNGGGHVDVLASLPLDRPPPAPSGGTAGYLGNGVLPGDPPASGGPGQPLQPSAAAGPGPGSTAAPLGGMAGMLGPSSVGKATKLNFGGFGPAQLGAPRGMLLSHTPGGGSSKDAAGARASASSIMEDGGLDGFVHMNMIDDLLTE